MGAWAQSSPGLSRNKLERAAQRGAAAASRAGRTIPLAQPLISITKAERRLVLYDGQVEVYSAPVGLGPNPIGHKQRQGDGRTPEGIYRVCTRNDRSRFHLFLGISYPGQPDADRGLRVGLISQTQYDAILAAWASRRRPPWDTRLGGEIGIHGSGASWDWTLGCIALNDPDIEVLWSLCPLGTTVRIEP